LPLVAVDGRATLRPWNHKDRVVAAKFAPDGCLIATVTSIQVYDNQNGSLLFEFPVEVNWSSNQPFAWASDSKH